MSRQTLFLILIILVFNLLSNTFQAQEAVPSVHSNLKSENGELFFEVEGRKFLEVKPSPAYTLEQMKGQPKGTTDGLEFFFGEEFTGTMYYGFIPYGDSKHPLPVYLYRSSKIENGKASINIARYMSGRFDMIGWEHSGKGTLGYRVLNEQGRILYDGIVSFKGKGPFEVDVTLTEGPFINLLQPDGATISFITNMPVKAAIDVQGERFSDAKSETKHEIKISGLQASKTYTYSVEFGGNRQTYSFKTAPAKGSRKPFTFAYASDSRSGQGGGERNLHGANSYIMKRIAALGHAKGVGFLQFTGDLINGYLTSPEQTNLQYANWKRSIQPFAHHYPVNAAMGNHEALNRKFREKGGSSTISVDRFPYSGSSEALFADNFVNPLNGPESEDGANYDPDSRKIDFPSYKETVFYYTYSNVAMVVLNSDYFYAPSTGNIPISSGGMHGYIMDEQYKWLQETIAMLEKDKKVSHIFLTLHTPFFPNGGHVGDDMWYRGDNTKRPYVNGQPLEKGILERRDQLLDLLVNKSKKVRAILTGDEHNYNHLELGPQTPIYEAGKDYSFEKIKLSRTIYQINNGAAGAPYYAQERTPWSEYVDGFTTQNALVFFHVKGKRIKVKVINPDTLELVDEFQLR